MQLPFVSRRQHEAVLADRERIRGERDQFAKDRDAFKRAAETAATKFAELDADSKRLDAERVAQLEAHVEELTALGVRANAALDDMADKVKAAEERARIAARPTVVEERTVDGAPLVRREPSSARLRRSEARCAALAEQLGLMQDSHIADTRELHDLRQGVKP